MSATLCSCGKDHNALLEAVLADSRRGQEQASESANVHGIPRYNRIIQIAESLFTSAPKHLWPALTSAFVAGVLNYHAVPDYMGQAADSLLTSIEEPKQSEMMDGYRAWAATHPIKSEEEDKADFAAKLAELRQEEAILHAELQELIEGLGAKHPDLKIDGYSINTATGAAVRL